MKWIAGLDPGTTKSALLVLDCETRVVRRCKIASNEEIRREVYALADESLESTEKGTLVIEKIENYGSVIGASILDTAVWIGRFFECYWIHSGGLEAALLPRRQVRLHLCGTMRAGDPEVRQQLIDRWGGERSMAVGTKNVPGPLYGVKSHLWSALALAVTYDECRGLAALPPLRGVA